MKISMRVFLHSLQTPILQVPKMQLAFVCRQAQAKTEIATIQEFWATPSRVAHAFAISSKDTTMHSLQMTARTAHIVLLPCLFCICT